MKKQSVKKLALAKETLQNLESNDLKVIAAGLSGEPCWGGSRWYQCWGTVNCPTVLC
jgi:hypothetical protein